jgi:hypothetical protein
MRRREFIVLLSRATKHIGIDVIFVSNIVFALIVVALIAIDLVAAEYAVTSGKMMTLHVIGTSASLDHCRRRAWRPHHFAARQAGAVARICIFPNGHNASKAAYCNPMNGR